MILLITLGLFLLLIAFTVMYRVWITYKSAKRCWSNASLFWKFKMRWTPWYCEYHSGIRIYDYFSIMIRNYPILTFRRWDDPHEDTWTSYTFGFLFLFDLNFHVQCDGEWLGQKWDQDAQRDLDDHHKVLEGKS